MPLSSVPSWPTSDGSLFTNHMNALKHELTTILSKSGGAEAFARRVVDGLDDPMIDKLIDHLSELKAERAKLARPPLTVVANGRQQQAS